MHSIGNLLSSKFNEEWILAEGKFLDYFVGIEFGTL